jgi:alkylated DNA repair dioxygenase AlkB
MRIVITKPFARYYLPDPKAYLLRKTVIDKTCRLDDESFEEIWNLHPKERGRGIMRGKEMEFPRWMQAYGDNYRFTGVDHSGLPIEHPFFLALLEYANRNFNGEFNQIFVNWYGDGFDYIGPHSDNEKTHVDGAPILSFSYGEERDFYVRGRKGTVSENFSIDFKMPHNSLIVMCGDTQKQSKHSVPKRTSKKNPLGRRINITVRQKCYTK